MLPCSVMNCWGLSHDLSFYDLTYLGPANVEACCRLKKKMLRHVVLLSIYLFFVCVCHLPFLFWLRKRSLVFCYMVMHKAFAPSALL